jgi:hypothetical protein
MRVDLHQHLWPAGLVEALRRRTIAPRLVGWTLHLAGEPPYVVAAADHDVTARAAQAAADGFDLVGVGLSSPLGLELLDPAQAQPLLEEWHQGAGAFGPPFVPWASAALVEPDLARIRRDLGRPGVIGLQVPATALATPAGVERIGGVLAVCADAGVPVLVHPGPVAASGGAQTAALPAWWSALVPYVGQQNAAWHAWQVAGAADHPTLRIAFVALAGLAPLHHERLAARGGGPRPEPPDRPDPHVFYETSSYGWHAIEAVARVVGAQTLVHGSDRPYATPLDVGADPARARPLFSTNPTRLLTVAL